MGYISGGMKVAAVTRRYPATIELFLARGCPDMRRGFFSVMARLMSVRRAAQFHGLELEALLRDLNEAARHAARGDAAARPGT
jgi:hypothetical protein